MKKKIIKKYAALIASTGANVQKGQPVKIYAAADQYEFVTLLAHECYKLGAGEIDVEWSWQPLTQLDYDFRSLESLSRVPQWQEEKLKLMTETLPCRIVILSEDPDGLAHADQEKMQQVRIARYPVIKPYRDAIENRHQWTIAAVPSHAWAKKVFPELSRSAAFESLWRAILECAYVTEDNDPGKAWQIHNENFKKRTELLNSYKFESLEYKSSNGTDFTVELIPEGHWSGGGENTIGGVYFNPNIPTQEIFTSPMKGKAEGTLVATKPLSYNGQIIEKFSITFKNGRAVSYKAEKGEELLGKIISSDEGAAMLGEVAIIPCNSPVNNSGILFFETLFDENASCHVALGRGFNDCIDDFTHKTNDECLALGINDSMIHVDFMIGSDDLCITGYKNGKSVPVLINGEWAQ